MLQLLTDANAMQSPNANVYPKLKDARWYLFHLSCLSSAKFDCTLCALDLWTFRRESSLLAVEEVLASDAAPIAHTSEYAALIVEVDGDVQFGYVASVHDEDAIVSAICQ